MTRLIFIAAVSSLLMGFGSKDQANSKAVKSQMHGLYNNLSIILPLYLKPFDFFEDSNKQKVKTQLSEIHVRSKKIQELLKSADEEHRILSKSLEHSADMALASFDKGIKGQAKYFMGEMLDTCMSCHTSRKSTKDSPFDLSRNVDIASLDGFSKAKLLTISRRFKPAMDEYEKLLLKSQLSISDIIHFDPFLNYLVLGVRVRPDLDRVMATLKKVADRPVPQSVKQDVKVWTKSLEDLQKKKWSKGTLLVQAKALMEKGKELMDYPRDQSGAIYYLEASRRLKDFIGIKKVNSHDRALAYLLMGKSEMVLGRPFLGLEARRYFETAIEMAPKTKMAKEAFRMYEEHVVFGYTGSSGLHLPDGEAEKLENLRKQAF